MVKLGKVLIVEARYYTHIADDLARGAIAVLEQEGIGYERLPVTGVFEVPAAIRLAERSDQYFLGYLALGCVIRGATDHYDHICREASRALMDIAVEDGVAVGFGILTCETETQATERADPERRNKGAEAAHACLRMMELRKAVPPPLGRTMETADDDIWDGAADGDRRSRTSRLVAVQVLYEMEMVDAAPDPILTDGLERRWVDAAPPAAEADATRSAATLPAPPRPDLISEIVRGTAARMSELDALISPLVRSERGLDSVDVLLRAVLRAGAFELLARPRVPARVVVSEYVDIAGAFFDAPQDSIANAILDKLARRLRADEFANSDTERPSA